MRREIGHSWVMVEIARQGESDWKWIVTFMSVKAEAVLTQHNFFLCLGKVISGMFGGLESNRDCGHKLCQQYLC